jgi:hypothetical protein
MEVSGQFHSLIALAQEQVWMQWSLKKFHLKFI